MSDLGERLVGVDVRGPEGFEGFEVGCGPTVNTLTIRTWVFAVKVLTVPGVRLGVAGVRLGGLGGVPSLGNAGRTSSPQIRWNSAPAAAHLAVTVTDVWAAYERLTGAAVRFVLRVLLLRSR